MQKVISGDRWEEVYVRSDANQPLLTTEGLAVPEHDYIELSYTGSNLTGVIYKSGGTWDTGTDVYSGGDTVATLELVYDGSNNLLKVAKV